MDFFGGLRPNPSSNDELLIAQDIARQQLENEQRVANAQARNKKINTKFRAGVNTAGARTAGVVGQTAEFVGVAERQGGADFSNEQHMLGQMFGQGEKIWGNVQEPVRINNDLNSSKSDPLDETSSMFGFGQQRERSGLF